MSHRKTSHRAKAKRKAFWRGALAAEYVREVENEDRRARREQNGRPARGLGGEAMSGDAEIEVLAEVQPGACADIERMAKACGGWVCEQHPGVPWPHDDCPGPGELADPDDISRS